MRCPHCGKDNDKVIESRQASSGTSIRRRRECNECSYRFTSYERIEERPLMVIKRSGNRETFDISKISRGLERSLEKRPVSAKTVTEMLADIEDQAHMIGKSSHEISAEEIGKLVLEKLYRIDSVAYVRFASVYRSYADVQEFIDEIKKLNH
ncbi:MAG: transcriptional regulator NrdR [Spirochaetales bacterium]|nr:transcriptional regulator NrdR [Spirochaetales bacterium]